METLILVGCVGKAAPFVTGYDTYRPAIMGAAVVPAIVMMLHAATVCATVTSSPYAHAQHPTGTLPLFAVADDGMAPGDLVTLQTLAGALARSTPQVYRVSSGLNGTDSYALWARELRDQYEVVFDQTYLNDLAGLIQHFAPNISGFVTFTNGNESANAAITYCAGSPPPSIVSDSSGSADRTATPLLPLPRASPCCRS